VHFSAVALMKDEKGLDEALLAGPYAEPALVPAPGWLSGRKPPRPVLALKGGKMVWVCDRPERLRFWALYVHRRGAWALFRVLPTELREYDLRGLSASDQAALAAVDVYGQESDRVVVDLRQQGSESSSGPVSGVSPAGPK